MFKRLFEAVKRPGFSQSLAAFAVSEAAAKVSRLVAIVALARMLTPVQMGIVAAAIAVAELLKALTENGVIQKIIAARPSDLEGVCQTGRRISTLWCAGLFTAQNLLALAIWQWGGQPEAALVIALMSGEYLFMPGGVVQCALAMREGRMAGNAAIAGAQNVAANLLLAVFVLVWPSPMAVAAARLASAPVWLVGMRRLRPWKPDLAVPRAAATGFVRFGSAIIGVELLRVARLQADKLIVGALMGPEVLGLYFFAFNAGLGIANSFAVAFSIAIFPHLCAAENRALALRSALGLSLAILTPVIVAQALLAPVYVPIVFGDQWAGLAGHVSILCFAALPGIVWAAVAQKLRADNQADREFMLSALIAATVTGAIALAAPFGLTTVIWTVLVATTLSQLAAAAIAMRPRQPQDSNIVRTQAE